MSKKFSLLFIFAMHLCSVSKAAQNTPPNIIVILVDTLRADYLGSYGFAGNISPNIDTFAATAFQFQKCTSQAPWTKPSISTLFTSLYPETHRVVYDQTKNYWETVDKKYKSNVLPEKARTMAEIFKEQGFETAGFSMNPWISQKFGFAQGFSQFESIDRSPDLINKMMFWLSKRNTERPFFLYLHFLDVHGPYQCSDEDLSAVINSPSLGIDAPLSSGNIEKFNNDINFSYLGDNIRWKNPEEKKTTKKWRGCYAAGIRNFDRTFGDLHGLLDNGGYLKNTIVVLTSDHGEELMDHGEWEHGYTLFEEQIHVPLMIKLPGSDKGGKITEICGLVDILPTLTDLTRVTTKKLTLQGRSLKMFLDHRKPGGEKNYFSSGVKNDPEMRSIQNARYKLITNSPAGSVSLFDLKEDPKELINIAEKNRPLKNKMLQKLGNHLRDLNRFPSLLEESTPIPDSLLEQLRSLGYLH